MKISKRDLRLFFKSKLIEILAQLKILAQIEISAQLKILA